MFLGHFAVALAAKRAVPATSLGTLVLAAQLADLVWPVLLLAGVETARIQVGASAVTPLLFDHYPWSHSLATLVLAGLVLGGCHFLWRRRPRDAFVLALLVPSHWLLDWVVHVPDLPWTPAPGSPLAGLGLWNSMPASLAIELGLFALGTLMYLRISRARDRIGIWSLAALLSFLVLVYAGNMLGPPPPGIGALAAVGLAQWLLVAWAAWADAHRRVRGSAL
jgi:hypothetical protein